ncbi:hypothetical protein FLBR109950_03120 [Flavobacterium branchiophilum]
MYVFNIKISREKVLTIKKIVLTLFCKSRNIKQKMMLDL